MSEPSFLGVGGGPAFDRLHVDPDQPPMRVIRQLLEEAFEPGSLRRFCRDRPDFVELLHRFGSPSGLYDMIDEVLTYCGTQLLSPSCAPKAASSWPNRRERQAYPFPSAGIPGGSPGAPSLTACPPARSRIAGRCWWV
jgi:hypothetical protein